MSAKEKRVERSQRFRRAWRGENRSRAVSPVVATLILILIAVAAAAALYLWLVVWQGNITGNIGGQHAEPTLTVGGSTSVYPFSSLATTWFEQNNSDVVVSDNQGGTGAGMLAVCGGSIDIGAASSLETAAGLISGDGCPASDLSTIQITTVAYDAVDVIVPVANTHGLQSISYDTLTAIYDGTSTAATLIATTVNGVAPPVAVGNGVALDWNEIPACVNSGAAATTNCGYDGTVSAGVAETSTGITVGATTGVCPAADPLLDHDICSGAGTTSPCGFTVCAGGTDDAIQTVDRSDASGTTQSFEARLLGASSSTAFETSFTGLGFSGCGSNNLLSDCGISTTFSENGNPAVISKVAAEPDAIGYASDGLARSSTSGVTCQGVATAACGIGFEAPGQGAAVQPALGATGSIAGGIVNGGFGTPGLTTTLTIAQSYAGARPFEFVSLQPYTGVGQEFVTFILDPNNNQALASATGEVSIYSI